MTFRDGDLLWLLLGIPVLAGLPVLAWWLRERAMRRFGDPAVTTMLIAGRSPAWRATRAVLFVSGIALAIVALAGPQWGSRTRVLRKRGIDVVIALDLSKSMLARDVRPSRIERAKAEILRFASDLDGDRVGIVAFAGETMEFPMTTDYSALGLFFEDLGPYDMPIGGTAIARALVASRRLLDRASQRTEGEARAAEGEERSRIVILMTDGEDTEGDPVAAAHELEEAGIRVFTVGIGSRTGEPIPTYAPDGTWTGYQRDEEGNIVQTALTEENEQQLQEIAQITGGRYFAAGRGSVGLDPIRVEMRRMHQQEQRTRRITVHEDRYALLLFPAFLLLVLEAMLPDAWIGRWRRRGGAPRRASSRPGPGRGKGREAR